MRAFACGEFPCQLFSFYKVSVLIATVSAQCKSWKFDETTQAEMDRVCKEKVFIFWYYTTDFLWSAVLFKSNWLRIIRFQLHELYDIQFNLFLNCSWSIQRIRLQLEQNTYR